MTNKRTLTHSERVILRRLDTATIDEPVSLNELRLLTNRSERKIKWDIEHLRRCGICVLAIRTQGVGKRTGYFIPKSEIERQTGLAPFVRQIKSEIEIKEILLDTDLNAHKQLLEVEDEHS